MRTISQILIAGVWVVVSSTTASAEWLNVDVDNPEALPQHGSGPPSSSFGAAANQPGFWNDTPGDMPGPFVLNDLSGSPTSVTMSHASTTGLTSLAYLNTTNTGDFALLLNDASQVGTTFQGGTDTYTFNGLTPGAYKIYTYSVAPQGTTVNAPVDVFGATGTNPQVVTGPMPGNAFALGITHSVHDVVVTSSGVLTVQVTVPPNLSAGAYVNGFQILQVVPEPGTLSLFALGVLAAPAIGRRRLHKRSSA